MKPRGAGDGGPAPNKHRRPVGAGLSLDKFATAGVSKYDKRKKIERIQKQKVIQHSKLSKLKKKLEAQGVLAAVNVKDSVAELEALDGPAPGIHVDSDRPHSEDDRVASHARAGPKTAGQGQKRPHPADDDEEEQEGGPGAQQQQHPGQRGPGKESRPAVDMRHISDKQRGAGNDDGGEEDGGHGKDERGRVGGRGDDGRGGGRDGGRGDGRKLTQLQRLAQKVAEEKEEKQRAKEVAMKEREERNKRVAAVEKVRKEQKHLHFKRNAKGQPLMRYRMDKLLEQIEQGTK